MKTVFRKDGGTLDYTPAADIHAGALHVVNGLVCLALWDIPANTAGTLKVLQRGEVVEVTTDTALGATAAGTKLYVTSAGAVSKTATDNTLIGVNAAAIVANQLTFVVVCA